MTAADGVDAPDSRAERVADAAVHAVGLIFGLAACVVLAIVLPPDAGPPLRASLGVYGAGLLAMLGCSALYNTSGDGPWKAWFRRLDHAAIFLMIAGTYTPFAAVAIGGPLGFALLIAVWTVALIGTAIKLLWPSRFKRSSIVMYLGLGWIGLIAVEPLIEAVAPRNLVLLGVGGAIYSFGVAVYLWDRLPFNRALWHLLVLIAAMCHFAAVLGEFATTS